MKTISLFFITVFFQFIYAATNAQEVRYLNYEGNGDYANSDSIFRPEGIASDFGHRKIDDNWHGGLDYNSGSGNADNTRTNGALLLTPSSEQ